MHKILFLTVAITFALCGSSVSEAETKVVIDPATSKINWVGEKVTGSHSGLVSVTSGHALVKDGKLVGGEFDIGMNSITVTDIKDSKDNAKLTGHLKSDDFFSAEKFPVAKFVITKVEPIQSKEGNYNITGTLNVKGITNEVTFPAQVTIDGDKASAKAEFKLDRTKWNVRYGSGKFFGDLGDKLIYDDFKVALDLAGTAKG
jgi:polyisoprenoid-binding protein YceI